jgi:hypothetical protein
MQQHSVRSLLSRRHFLAGSAALAASTSLFALDVDWAAPRGKERNLLAAAYSPEKLKQALIAQDHPDTLPAICNETELRAQPPAQPRLLRDTWLPDSRIMAARRKAESSDGLYLACIAADNGKSHSHNDTGSFWVYSEGLPVLMDMGQETYQKKSFDAHR